MQLIQRFFPSKSFLPELGIFGEKCNYGILRHFIYFFPANLILKCCIIPIIYIFFPKVVSLRKNSVFLFTKIENWGKVIFLRVLKHTLQTCFDIFWFELNFFKHLFHNSSGKKYQSLRGVLLISSPCVFRSMYAILHVTESTHEHETKSESPEIEVRFHSLLTTFTEKNSGLDTAV